MRTGTVMQQVIISIIRNWDGNFKWVNLIVFCSRVFRSSYLFITYFNIDIYIAFLIFLFADGLTKYAPTIQRLERRKKRKELEKLYEPLF